MQLSEMSVEVEASSFLRPLTVDDSSWFVAPNPPLRQAAGRYVTFVLVWCDFIDNHLKFHIFRAVSSLSGGIMRTRKVVVVPYDEKWEQEFEKIKQELSCKLDNLVIAIEHVGSTSVEGLAAKPVIDIDIVIKDYNFFEAVKGALSQIGYTHEGDLGVKDRQAFKYSDKPHLMRHHLYVCPEYSEELKRHIV